MTKLKYLIFLSLLLIAFNVHAKKQNIIKIPAGSNVPSVGVAMDASYDEKFDNIIPGYKILTVAITNNSIDIIQMDSSQDKWSVVDVKGNKHDAVIDLRIQAPNTYVGLPDRLRKLISYPTMIQVAETKPIDLLFKNSVKLDGFRSVLFTSGPMARTFEIVTRE